MSGLLNTPEIINANMQTANRGAIGAAGVGVSAATVMTLDNAVLRAAGMVRHIRRIIIQNLDNTVRVATFGTCTADSTNGVAVALVKQVTNFGTLILEPENPGDDLFLFIRAATVTRFGVWVDAAAATGVQIGISYYDDVG